MALLCSAARCCFLCSTQVSCDRGDFMEYAEVFGDYKGTAWKSLDDAKAHGKDLLLDIDIQGTAQVRKQFPQAVTIFEQQQTPKVRHEVIEILDGTLVNLLVTGHFRGVAHVLREVQVTAQRAPNITADRRMEALRP